MTILALTLAVLLSPSTPAVLQESDDNLAITEALRLGRAGQGGRTPLFTDAVEWQIARGEWQAPSAGATVELPDGNTAKWEAVQVNDGGSFDPGGAYTFCTVDVPEDGVWVLEARGHRQVRVNGVPRGGDVYNFGWIHLPVSLRSGTNELLFRAGRGRLSVKLSRPPAPVFFERRDDIVPDVLADAPQALWATVLVTNATEEWQRDLRIRAAYGEQEWIGDVPPMPPTSQRKVAVQCPPTHDLPAERTEERTKVTFELALLSADGSVLNGRPLDVGIRTSSEHHRRTFLSDIDGSVQYYGIAPPLADAEVPDTGLSLVLSLHGAGVEGIGQARCYRPRDWCVVAAPTNRRKFGFDWEDWGRLDALEVMADARKHYPVNARRMYLTGHSMGGHGTWNLGVHRPDLFAAIGPSAGWRDFWSYGGAGDYANDGDAARMLDRAVNASRTLLLLDNYRHQGVYVLHGDKDNNVPVSQARFMREKLSAFHPNWAYYERPGAGHWWGNQCVDWPPLMEFLQQNEQPDPSTVHKVKFTTVNPGILSQVDWATIESQQHSMQPSTVDLAWKAKDATIAGTTDNVRRLLLDLQHLPVTKDGVTTPAVGDALTVRLDGQEIASVWPSSAALRLHRVDENWTVIDDAPLPWKTPRRAGPFKDAFRHRMQFVVATGGDDAEDAWALAKARFDAETFQYRGNGSVDIVLDTEFDPTAEPDRGVILYGNADTNTAWDALLGHSGVQVFEGVVSVGDEMLEGDDLACLFLAPRPGSELACVAAVSASGPAGRVATDVLPYFVSGVAYPDWIVLGADFLWRGAAGVVGAGFLDETWSVSEVDSAWSDDG